MTFSVFQKASLEEHFRIVNFHVFRSIEGVVADQLEVADFHIFTVHGEIITLGGNLVHGDTAAVPEGLGCVRHKSHGPESAHGSGGNSSAPGLRHFSP